MARGRAERKPVRRRLRHPAGRCLEDVAEIDGVRLTTIFAERLNLPFGIAFRGEYVCRANTDEVVSRDGKQLFISTGSRSNVSIESDARRGAILVSYSDGSHARVYASGLRNAVDLTMDPESGVVDHVNEVTTVGTMDLQKGLSDRIHLSVTVMK